VHLCFVFRGPLSDKKDKVKTFVQPSSETVSVFNAFATTNGLKPTVISPNGDWVSITLPVFQANQLFAAQFEVFAHPDSPQPITRTLSVSLPSELVGHVDVLHPTTAFAVTNARLGAAVSNRYTPPRTDSCNTNTGGVITPACLQAIYGIPSTPVTQMSNGLLITAYFDQYAQTADLTVCAFQNFKQRG
jgi:tripeptidyl-peptidase-1